MVNANQLFNIANLRNIAVHMDAINLDCKKAKELLACTREAGLIPNVELKITHKIKIYKT